MRNGFALAAVLAVAVVTGLVLWLGIDDRGAAPPPIEPPATTGGATPIGATKTDDAAPPQPTTADPAPPAESTPTVGSEPTNDSVASRPRFDGPLVRVVDAAGTPVAGATIHFTSTRAGSWRRRPRYEPPCTIETDTAGEARLPFFRTYGEVCATHRLGTARFTAPASRWYADDAVVLRLAPTRTLAVDVVDEHGAPADGIRLVAMPGATGSRYPLRATTDRAGRATFVFSEATLPTATCIEVDLPLAVGVHALVAPNAWPARPIRLQLPPLITLVVEMQTKDGKREARPTEIRLSYGMDSYEQRRVTVDGRAMFPRIGIGASVRLAASRQFLRGSTTVTANETPDGTQTVTLRSRTADACSLVGRIATVRGTRIRAVGRVLYPSRGPDSVPREVRFSRDVEVAPDGSFSIASARPIRVLRSLRFVAYADEDIVATSPIIPVVVDAEATTIRLGTIPLADAPLWVSGTVVDRFERPVALARVSAEGAADEGTETCRTVTDRHGRFALRGIGRPATMTVVASRPDHADSVHDVSLGTADVVLRIARYGDVGGLVTLPPAFRADWFYAALIGSTLADPRRRRLESLSIDDAGDGRGRFAATAVEPGNYDIAFHVVGSDTPLLRLPGITVIEEGKTPDGRLRSIDLRGSVRTVTVRVLGGDGAPVANAAITACGAKAGRYTPRRTVRTDARGEVRLPASANGTAFEIAAPGYRTVRTEARSDRTIRLAHGVPVAFDLGSGIRTRDHGKVLVMRLAREDDDDLASPARALYGVLPDDDDAIAFVVDRPGTYSATLRLCPVTRGASPRNLYRARRSRVLRSTKVTLIGDQAHRVAMPIEPGTLSR